MIAKRALEEMRYPSIKGVQCRVLPYSQKFAKLQSKAGDGQTEERETYIFVKGFQRARWLHSDLHKAFEKFGSILSAKVSIDKNHMSKGFGYIQFESKEQAALAIQ